MPLHDDDDDEMHSFPVQENQSSNHKYKHTVSSR